MGRRGLVTQVDLDEWVEIARHRLAVVEVLGLVDDQSHDTDVYEEKLAASDQWRIGRCTRLWKLLDGPLARLGQGDDGIEVDFESEFTTVFTVLQDWA